MSIPREGSRDTDKGILISKYPDWCKTPDKPIPYTIYAKQDDDANTAPTVRLTGKRSQQRVQSLQLAMVMRQVLAVV